MNFYEKHIGDYIRDTVSLSMLEDGAYNRLIDQCYQTEKPLPADKKMVYRLARATSAAERKAVDFVLHTYFVLAEDGYAQKRIQAEIERYWDRDLNNQNAKENQNERQRRSRERRKALFDALRGHGITPEFNTPTKELSRILSRMTGGDESHQSHVAVTCDDTSNQTPDTSKPTTTTCESTTVATCDSDAVVVTSASPTRVGQICLILRKAGVRPLTPSHPQALEWAKDDRITDKLLLDAMQEARDYKPAPEPVHPNYLKRIVERLLKDGKGGPELEPWERY